MRVSVVIPARDEEQRIAAAIDAARAAGASEIIVADGGSSDRTGEIAERHGAIVLSGERIRALQSNQGAAKASGEIVLFLHADTLLPEGGCDAVRQAVSAGAAFGGFSLAFIEDHLSLRLAAWLINLRTRLTREPWGDQAQFVLRDVFLESGGFRADPLMEDYELARRMRRGGPVAILPLRVKTSGRRFLERGVLRTVVTNWLIVAAWHLGVPAETLARWYRK